VKTEWFKPSETQENDQKILDMIFFFGFMGSILAVNAAVGSNLVLDQTK
jgi:hypothetical protein